MAIKDKRLSYSAAFLMDILHGKSIRCFTTDKAYHLLKSSSKNSVKRMLGKMVKRGLLMRIKGGLYYIVPFEQDAKTFMPDWHILSQHLTGETNYYIGYYSALQIHSLTTQPALKEQIVVSKQIKPSQLKVKEISFQFIYHNEKHFFGSKKTWIDSFNKVQCADLEKTFIDCLFKPEYVGGITEIAKAIHKSKKKIDYPKLFEYAKQFNSQAVIKRLGFLLELLGIKHLIVEKLQKLRTNSFVLLEPKYPKEGKTIFRWAIQQNLDTNSIFSSIFN